MNLKDKIKLAHKRYKEDEIFRIAVDSQARELAAGVASEEHKRMMRDYELFEELSPPDVPRREFVKWCYDAWDKKNEDAAELVEIIRKLCDSPMPSEVQEIEKKMGWRK